MKVISIYTGLKQDGKILRKLSLAFLLLVQGCVYSKGQSSYDMQRNMEKSIAFYTFDKFYPKNKIVVPHHNAKVNISEHNREQLKHMLLEMISSLTTIHKKTVPVISQDFESMLTSEINIKLDEVTNDGYKICEVTPDGKLTIDVKFLLDLFAKSILITRHRQDSLQLSDTGSFEFNDKEISQALHEFLKIKMQIKNSETNYFAICDIFNSSETWFNMSEYNRYIEKINLYYIGMLLFVISHEIGHLALQHKKSTDCPEFEKMELEADKYASALIAYQIPEIFTFGLLEPLLRGFDGFFSQKHNEQDPGGCKYPPIEKRKKLASDMYQKIQNFHRNNLKKSSPLNIFGR